MKKILLAFAAPLGIIIWLAYTIINRFVAALTDQIAVPLSVISVILMLIGIAYNGYCFGKHKSPYDFKPKSQEHNKPN